MQSLGPSWQGSVALATPPPLPSLPTIEPDPPSYDYNLPLVPPLLPLPPLAHADLPARRPRPWLGSDDRKLELSIPLYLTDDGIDWSWLQREQFPARTAVEIEARWLKLSQQIIDTIQANWTNKHKSHSHSHSHSSSHPQSQSLQSKSAAVSAAVSQPRKKKQRVESYNDTITNTIDESYILAFNDTQSFPMLLTFPELSSLSLKEDDSEILGMIGSDDSEDEPLGFRARTMPDNESDSENDSDAVALGSHDKKALSRWSEKDDERLIFFTNKLRTRSGIDWNEIAKHFAGRTIGAMRQRFSKIKLKDVGDDSGGVPSGGDSRLPPPSQAQLQPLWFATPTMPPKPRPHVPALSLSSSRAPWTPQLDHELVKCVSLSLQEVNFIDWSHRVHLSFPDRTVLALQQRYWKIKNRQQRGGDDGSASGDPMRMMLVPMKSEEIGDNCYGGSAGMKNEHSHSTQLNDSVINSQFHFNPFNLPLPLLDIQLPSSLVQTQSQSQPPPAITTLPQNVLPHENAALLAPSSTQTSRSINPHYHQPADHSPDHPLQPPLSVDNSQQPWNDEQDNALLVIIRSHRDSRGKVNWRPVHQQFPQRSLLAIQKRYRKTIQSKLEAEDSEQGRNADDDSESDSDTSKNDSDNDSDSGSDSSSRSGSGSSSDSDARPPSDPRRATPTAWTRAEVNALLKLGRKFGVHSNKIDWSDFPFHRFPGRSVPAVKKQFRWLQQQEEDSAVSRNDSESDSADESDEVSQDYQFALPHSPALVQQCEYHTVNKSNSSMTEDFTCTTVHGGGAAIAARTPTTSGECASIW